MNELIKIMQIVRKKQADINILKFKKFSACFVFILNRITQDIYKIYWMYTRSKIINSIHENKISMNWFYAILLSSINATYTLMLCEFIDDDSYLLLIAILSIFISILLSAISYLVVIFKMKNRLNDIMNNSNTNEYYLSNIFTFLFGDIYLQYKINKCIDDCSDKL